MTAEILMGDIEQQAPARTDVLYDGSACALAGISFTNALLTLATLGFYRFWGRTRLRRYLWSRVSLDGDPLEYVGTGKELFLGFCIGLLILLPLFAVPAVAEILFLDQPEIFVVAQLGYLLALLWFIQVAIFRARRYRLSRTKWRGVRAGQTGSGSGYALLVFGTGLLNLLTLYIYQPWARTARQRYLMQRTWFGNEKFSFKAKGSALLAPWLLVILPVFAAIAIGGISYIVSQVPHWHQPKWVMLMPPLFLLFAGVMYLRYRVWELRYYASCTRFMRCRLHCSLCRMKVVFVIIACGLLMLGAFVGISALVLNSVGLSMSDLQEISVVLQEQTGPEGRGSLLDWLSAIGERGLFLTLLLWMVLIAVTFSVLRVAVYLHWMYRLVFPSLSLTEVEEFAVVARSKTEGPRFGEGLADALDVGEIGF